MMLRKRSIFTLFIAGIFVQSLANAQDVQKRYRINGYVLDERTYDPLVGANIYIMGKPAGAATNQDGYFVFNLPGGIHTIIYEYIGYTTIQETITIKEDITKRIYLNQDLDETETIISTADKATDNITSTQMSMATIDSRTINQIPAVLGESDLLKSIQLLPGVSTVGEGVSGFSVRGGNFDQNLVLLDQAPLLNPSHLFGFFSVFNTEATNDLSLYKGGIPARYGGRLSSVLDVRQRSGSPDKFNLQGGIGLVSSRLLVEGPVGQEVGSYLVAGRRSYGDLFLPLFKINNTAYFYDLNWKVNLNLSKRDLFSFFGYHGQDKFEIADVFGNLWGNTAIGLNWNHIFSNEMAGLFSLIYARYDYGLDILADGTDFAWRADIGQIILQSDFTYGISDNLIADFGLRLAYYNFQPGNINPVSNSSSVQPTTVDQKYAYEPAAYLNFDQKISTTLSAQYGLRLSAFSRVGPQTIYQYQDNQPVVYNDQLGRYESGTVTDRTSYGSNQSIRNFYALEPRFTLRWSPDDKSAIKISYNRMKQYIHLISNTTAPSPLDIWTPSGPYIDPQSADQIALGYFRNFMNNTYETSIELYYKKLDNQIDYIDGADLVFNNTLETEILKGEGRAYGLELYIKKRTGRLTGWISYTLSRAEKRIPGISNSDPGINNGHFYPANYDKRHDLSVTGAYRLNEDWSFSANFIYTTGRPITYPSGRYEYAGLVLAHYENRNANRFPDYHRLDLSATLFNKWGGDWTFSIYNIYNQMNASSITFRPNEDDPLVTEAVRTTIFGFVPSITYSFRL